jgi:restriction system protein
MSDEKEPEEGLRAIAGCRFDARADIGAPMGAVASVTFSAHARLSQLGGQPLPTMIIKAELLSFGDTTPEGRLVEAVAIPWFAIIERLQDRAHAYEIDPRKWEEIIAGAYEQAGFDEVLLTPRSGDFGRDVIATITGVGSIRIFDQVKAYAPDRPVPAKDVRELIGVITGAQNVSKGVITTTSTFAPHVEDDPFIKPFLPHRIELKPWDVLIPWLQELAKRPRK